MNEVLKEKNTPKEKWIRTKKGIFRSIRFLFLGILLTSCNDYSVNPQKAVSDILNNDNTNSPVLDNIDLIDLDDKLKEPLIAQELNPDGENLGLNEPISSNPDPDDNSNIPVIEVLNIKDKKYDNQDIDPIPNESEKLSGGAYESYILDEFSEHTVGIVVGDRNSLTPAIETNDVITNIFLSHPFMRSVVKMFNPEINEAELEDYLQGFLILSGEDVDSYLSEGRKGSWGTTMATFTKEGKLKFKTISLKSDLLSPDYDDDDWDSLERLVLEEFFQVHQYDLFAELYNSGYLEEVAGIQAVDEIVGSLSDQNLRAFLELFPQQKMLSDAGVGGNAYNFYIGKVLYIGYANEIYTIDSAYSAMTSFIEEELGIVTSPESFLDPDFIITVNNEFRQKYTSYYLALGFTKQEIQIWNLVGMKRDNVNSNHSLDMEALLPLPSLNQN